MSSNRGLPQISILTVLRTDQGCIHLFNVFLLNIAGSHTWFPPPPLPPHAHTRPLPHAQEPFKNGTHAHTQIHAHGSVASYSNPTVAEEVLKANHTYPQTNGEGAQGLLTTSLVPANGY